MAGETKLSNFIRRNSLSVQDLASASGVSKRHLFYLKAGEASPTLDVASAIVSSASQLTGKRVRISDLFEIERAAS